MNRITYFNNIHIVPKKRSIMSRLGYKSRSAAMSEKDISFIDDNINLGLALCRNQGATGRFDITGRTTVSVTLSGGDSFESLQLTNLLRKSGEILLMAGTAGSEITTAISNEMKKGNAATAVVLDAVASCSADMTLDWLMEAFNKTLIKEGKKLTRRRFSPGFGDLALSNQAIIFNLLNLDRLNLELTDTMMLMPEKSVLAIAGIEPITSH